MAHLEVLDRLFLPALGVLESYLTVVFNIELKSTWFLDYEQGLPGVVT